MNIKINNSKIQVNWIKVSSYLGEVIQLKSYLTPAEIEKVYKYKFDKDRSRFIVGRALLRKMLGNILDFDPYQIKIESDNYGKLFLSNQEQLHLHFNLSHSEDYIIYAFCFKDEIGIDIEIIDSSINHLEIAKNYFSANEIAYLENSNDQNRRVEEFFRIWTRKEALLKAMGIGLLFDFKEIDVTNDSINLSQIKIPSTRLKNWTINDIFIHNQFKVAVAYSEAPRQVTVSEYNN